MFQPERQEKRYDFYTTTSLPTLWTLFSIQNLSMKAQIRMPDGSFHNMAPYEIAKIPGESRINSFGYINLRGYVSKFEYSSSKLKSIIEGKLELTNIGHTRMQRPWHDCLSGPTDPERGVLTISYGGGQGRFGYEMTSEGILKGVAKRFVDNFSISPVR